MQILLTKEEQDYIQLLKEKAVHLVGFAEEGLSYFRAYLECAFNYSLDDAISLCNKINQADETWTIFPTGRLTGMPVRFFRQPMTRKDLTYFRR